MILYTYQKDRQKDEPLLPCLAYSRHYSIPFDLLYRMVEESRVDNYLVVGWLALLKLRAAPLA